MPAREISTTIKLNGEEKFNAALREAQREMRVMASDLKAAAAEFEFTGDKQQLLTAKSRTLRDEIAQQDKIVEALTQAVKDSAEKYGDASKQTDGYRIKLSNATSTLFKLKQQLAETDREAEELGRDSTRVGRQIKDGIGDAAEETSESLDDMIKKLSSDIGDIKGSTAFTALSAGANFVTGSIDKIVDFVDSSREYRNKHALATSAIERNLNASEEEINNLYLQIVGVTGDMDGANEAMVTLSKIPVPDINQLTNVVDMLLGSFIMFGEEAKIEDLAESLQETIATGALTGKIAELYERLGLDVEAINKAIKDLPPEQRIQALMNSLVGTGVTEVREAYFRDNENLIKENQKMAELELARANLADELSPIVIGINDKLISIINSITNTISILKGDVDKAYEELNKNSPQFADALQSGQLDTMGGTLKYVWDQMFGRKQEGEEKSDLGSEFEQKGTEAAEAYTNAVEQTITDKVPTMQEITAAFFSGGDEAVQSLIDSLVMSDDEKAELINMLKELGLSSGQNYDTGMQESMKNAADNAAISGSNVGTSLKNGLDRTMPLAVASAQNYAAQINAAYASIGAGLNTTVVPSRVPGQPTTGSTGSMTARNTPIILEMSGRELGRAFLPTINTMQGRSLVRTSIT